MEGKQIKRVTGDGKKSVFKTGKRGWELGGTRIYERERDRGGERGQWIIKALRRNLPCPRPSH